MQFESMGAWQVEVGDFLSLGASDTVFEVVDVMDNDDGVTFVLRDDEGEKGEATFLTDENVFIVSSFEDED